MVQKITSAIIVCILVLSLSGQLAAAKSPMVPAGTVYYVSSSQGNDDYTGLSESTPFANINKVNSLALQPGDTVKFKCGDVWRADPLIITRSGSAGQPITFTSYPAGCANQPVFSGTQTVSGWAT